ncbi:hypothetical protein N7495_009694 [Penicillium taxi]|uniref:uncharacterized protein n=1 Tax=Penicillium taxi TaxID=168475 RepID=UPI0025459A9E|nr:uncharacterized protein N7495_009694 [Penicillium taxi]KAJ5885184.1 hypothetical protein N7495_009694 [Penicillium taxi]
MSVAIEPAPASDQNLSDGVQKLRLQSVDLEQHQDSGYFTQSQTPDRNSKQSSRSSSSAVDRFVAQTRMLRSGANHSEDLSEFDVPVEAVTISRFANIQPQIERALLKYVHKTPGKHRAMAIRLMVLGASAAQAKPHIVVLVTEEVYKRVRKFFDKTSVQSLVRPCDETLPSFEVLIYARPPEPKQAEHDDIDVLVPLINGGLGFNTDTFCGAPIIIRHPSGVEKIATFGGIIKAVDRNGEFKLYGLTAGHVVGDWDDYVSVESASDTGQNDDELLLSESDPDSDSDLESNFEMSEIVEPVNKSEEITEDAAAPSNEPEKVLILQDSLTAWTSFEFGNVGVISKDSPQMNSQSSWQKEGGSAYFDWALIEISSYKPNHLRSRALSADGSSELVASTSGDLVKPLAASTYRGVKKSVIVISGSEGPKRGTISALPSRILLGPGKEFIDALVVNLDGGKARIWLTNEAEIADGDSGSWVVNERSREVYGHIIAADAFGGGYIIPMDDTLRDIKTHLQVEYVDVASLVDIASVSMVKMTSVTAVDDETKERAVSESMPEPKAPEPQEQVNVPPRTRRSQSRGYNISGTDANDDKGPQFKVVADMTTEVDDIYLERQDIGSRNRRRYSHDYELLPLVPRGVAYGYSVWPSELRSNHRPVMVFPSFTDSGYGTRDNSARSSASAYDIADSGYGTGKSSANSSRASSGSTISGPRCHYYESSAQIHSTNSRPEVSVNDSRSPRDRVSYHQDPRVHRSRSMSRNSTSDISGSRCHYESSAQMHSPNSRPEVIVNDSRSPRDRTSYHQDPRVPRSRYMTDEEPRIRRHQRGMWLAEEDEQRSRIDRVNEEISILSALPQAPITRYRRGSISVNQPDDNLIDTMNDVRIRETVAVDAEKERLREPQT